MCQEICKTIVDNNWRTSQEIHTIYQQKYPDLDIGINSLRMNLRKLAKHKMIKLKTIKEKRTTRYVYKK